MKKCAAPIKRAHATSRDAHRPSPVDGRTGARLASSPLQRAGLTGRVVTGQGQGASFTRLDWVRKQLVAELGIDPFPGTLNLTLADDALPEWRAFRSQPGVVIRPPEPGFCDGRAYAVRIAGRVPGAIVVPDVPGYPDAQLELLAAVPLRELLRLADGDSVSLTAALPLRVKAVLFDVDGTLVDSIPALLTVARRAAPGLPVSEELVRRTLNEQRFFWDSLLPPEAPGRAERIAAMTAEALRLWPEVLREHARAVPGLAATLDALRARGLKLGIVTGAREGSFEPLRRAGVFERFAAVITRAQVARGKPHPDSLLMGAEALAVAAADAVYVGDTPIDVEAARAAGMSAVAVLSGAGNSALLSAAGPDRIVSSVARLPQVLEAA